jgi:hypothetical protein
MPPSGGFLLSNIVSNINDAGRHANQFQMRRSVDRAGVSQAAP